MLKGHSGCIINIVDDKVIKTAKSDKYSIDRLQAQKQKQERFKQLSLPKGIYTPAVLGDTYSMEMEYCPSLNILQFLVYASKEQVDLLCGSLKLLVFELSSLVVPIQDVYPQIKQKYLDICGKCDLSGVADIFYKLLPGSRTVPDVIEVPVGICHGDLTLSNVLIDTLHQRIVLVDFLDSFIESPLIDIVKLRQDTKHYWTCFLNQNEYDQTRIKTMLDYMDKNLDDYFKEAFPYYNKFYTLFQYINLLRILPYSQDQKTTDYLKEQIKCLPH